MEKTIRVAICIAAISMATGTQATAQGSYPSKPIRVLVGLPAGGVTDVAARIVADKIGPMLGQPVVIENKPGASGHVAGEIAANAAPDGYTLIVGSLSTNVLSLGLYRKLPYDPDKTLTPIALSSSAGVMLGVANNLGVKDLKSFIALVKQNPGKYSFASAGNGGVGHISAALFNLKLGLDAEHIPYRGSPEATNDLVAGRVAYLFNSITSLGPQAEAGKVTALAVMSSERSPLFPNVPTAEEAGISGISISSWDAWMAPTGTPPAVVSKLHDAIVKALEDPEVRARLIKTGNMAPPPLSVGELAKFIQDEKSKWLPAVEASGAKIE